MPSVKLSILFVLRRNRASTNRCPPFQPQQLSGDEGRPPCILASRIRRFVPSWVIACLNRILRDVVTYLAVLVALSHEKGSPTYQRLI